MWSAVIETCAATPRGPWTPRGASEIFVRRGRWKPVKTVRFVITNSGHSRGAGARVPPSFRRRRKTGRLFFSPVSPPPLPPGLSPQRLRARHFGPRLLVFPRNAGSRIPWALSTFSLFVTRHRFRSTAVRRRNVRTRPENRNGAPSTGTAAGRVSAPGTRERRTCPDAVQRSRAAGNYRQSPREKCCCDPLPFSRHPFGLTASKTVKAVSRRRPDETRRPAPSPIARQSPPRKPPWSPRMTDGDNRGARRRTTVDNRDTFGFRFPGGGDNAR